MLARLLVNAHFRIRDGQLVEKQRKDVQLELVVVREQSRYYFNHPSRQSPMVKRKNRQQKLKNHLRLHVFLKHLLLKLLQNQLTNRQN